MKEFIRPLNKTIYGRITNAKLSDLENEIRKYILKNYISKGIAPEIKDLLAHFKISENELIKVLGKLKKFDIIKFENDQILCSYPFSNKQTDFIVKINDCTNVFALCATDAFGIHFLSKQNSLIISKCPSCQKDFRIHLQEGKISEQEPDHIVEFVSLPENCGCTSDSFCPTIKLFCNKEHINDWKLKHNYDFSGEIYELTEVASHSKTIFSDLLDL